ncbi:MAG TPA: hypothetical protein VHC19_03615 [Pirellulales bacterium]|nr:hypothetical protein [Pirellulales bacterium]
MRLAGIAVFLYSGIELGGARPGKGLREFATQVPPLVKLEGLDYVLDN